MCIGIKVADAKFTKLVSRSLPRSLVSGLELFAPAEYSAGLVITILY